MDQSTTKEFIFIADRDEEFAESIKKNVPEGLPAVITISSFQDGKKHLTRSGEKLAGIFINPSIGSPGWLNLVRLTHLHQPGKPICILLDKDGVITADCASLGVRGPLTKPISYDEMLKQLRASVVQAPVVQKPVETGKRNLVKLQPPEKRKDSDAVDDSEFVPIWKYDLPVGVTSTFSMFVKIAPGHYVKVIKAGDVISQDQVTKYLSKNLKALFVPKNEQIYFMNYCDEEIAKVLGDPKIPLKEKVLQSGGQGAVVMGFLQSSSVSDESISKALKYVDNTHEMLSAVSKSEEGMTSFLSDLRSFDHGVAVSMVGGLFLTGLGNVSDFVFDSIGLACMLHDLSLTGKSDALFLEDEARMTEAEKAIFLKHPKDSAALLEKRKGIPQTVLEAIELHHMRLYGKGFPEKRGTGTVNRIAEVIGVSDEFIKLTKRAEIDSHVNPLEEMKQRILPQFSEPIGRAFEKIFLKLQK